MHEREIEHFLSLDLQERVAVVRETADRPGRQAAISILQAFLFAESGKREINEKWQFDVPVWRQMCWEFLRIRLWNHREALAFIDEVQRGGDTDLRREMVQTLAWNSSFASYGHVSSLLRGFICDERTAPSDAWEALLKGLDRILSEKERTALLIEIVRADIPENVRKLAGQRLSGSSRDEVIDALLDCQKTSKEALIVHEWAAHPSDLETSMSTHPGTVPKIYEIHDYVQNREALMRVLHAVPPPAQNRFLTSIAETSDAELERCNLRCLALYASSLPATRQRFRECFQGKVAVRSENALALIQWGLAAFHGDQDLVSDAIRFLRTLPLEKLEASLDLFLGGSVVDGPGAYFDPTYGSESDDLSWHHVETIVLPRFVPRSILLSDFFWEFLEQIVSRQDKATQDRIQRKISRYVTRFRDDIDQIAAEVHLPDTPIALPIALLVRRI